MRGHRPMRCRFWLLLPRFARRARGVRRILRRRLRRGGGAGSESVACAAAGDSVMGVGCAGPVACAEALDVSAEELAPCESSARFIVYERNGGSSVEETAACETGADREGPLSSSGTNNTISTTRMIAPVSRSFTRLSKIGSEPVQSSATAFSISQATASPAPRCGTSRTPARDPLAWP